MGLETAYFIYYSPDMIISFSCLFYRKEGCLVHFFIHLFIFRNQSLRERFNVLKRIRMNILNDVVIYFKLVSQINDVIKIYTEGKPCPFYSQIG